MYGFHKNNMKFLTITEVVFLGYFSIVYAAFYINVVIVRLLMTLVQMFWFVTGYAHWEWGRGILILFICHLSLDNKFEWVFSFY